MKMEKGARRQQHGARVRARQRARMDVLSCRRLRATARVHPSCCQARWLSQSSHTCLDWGFTNFYTFGYSGRTICKMNMLCVCVCVWV